MSEKDEDAIPAWGELVKDFTQETTLHGIRFTTLATVLLRRGCWCAVVLAALCCFAYLVIQRAQKYSDHGTSVGIDVTYPDKLPFPAVTVCNHNYFRATKAFSAGLFDVVENVFSVEDFNTSDLSHADCGEDSFIVYQHTFLEGVAEMYRKYTNISAEVCKSVCVDEASSCNIFLYDRATRSCYTSSIVPAEGTLIQHSATDVYERFHCPLTDVKRCDQEADSCRLLDQDEFAQLQWVRASRNGRDHTLGNGHFFRLPYVQPAQTLQMATLMSQFVLSDLDTLCVELFYRISGDQGDVGSLLLLQRFTNQEVTLLWQDNHVTHDFWKRLVRPLVSRLSQVLIVAVIGYGPTVWYEVDDVSIGPCTQMELDCVYNVQYTEDTGESYTGQVSHTQEGAACQSWVNTPYFNLSFPHEGAVGAGSYCRNPDNRPEPWCVTASGEESCKVPRCECGAEEFQCPDGVCVYLSDLCNGVADCSCKDGEICHAADESPPNCEVSVSCGFETVFQCGYMSDIAYNNLLQWELGSTRDTSIPLVAYMYDLGSFLYLNSRSASVLEGQRAAITSPEVAAGGQHCLSFTAWADAVSGAVAGSTLHLLQMFTLYDRKLVHTFQTLGYGTNLQVVLPASDRSYHIVLEAEVGQPFQSDVALDDVTLTSGSCDLEGSEEPASCGQSQMKCTNGRCVALESRCNGVNDCYDNSDEEGDHCSIVASVTCDFRDDVICGYRREVRNTLSAHWTRDLLDGAGNLSGMKAELSVNSSIISPGLQLRLVSPWHTSSSAKCLTFLHWRPTDTRVNLTLYQELDYSRTVLYQEAGSSSHVVWVSVPPGRFQLVWEVHSEELLDLYGRTNLTAVADIQLQDSNCGAILATGTPGYCAFEQDWCGYQDGCKEGLIWQLGSAPAGLTLVSEDVGQPSTPSTAVLWSPTFNVVGDACVILKFKVTVQTEIKAQTLSIFDSPLTSLGSPGGGFTKDSLCGSGTGNTPGRHLGEVSLFSAEGDIWLDLPSGVHRLKIVTTLVPGSSVTFSSQQIFLGACSDTESCASSLLYCDTGARMRVCTALTKACDDMTVCSWDGVYCDNRTAVAAVPPASTPMEVLFEDVKDALMKADDIRPKLTIEMMGKSQDVGVAGLEEFYTTVGHQKEDMIFKCMFEGARCSSADFLSQVTDFGLCHTFNAAAHGKEALYTNNVGSGLGLKLTINVEQYEYMAGPQDDAGVKIYLHADDEIPQVRDLGFAAAPGMHTLVAITYNTEGNLMAPWGQCGEILLNFTERYTLPACKLEEETQRLVDRCGCRDVYMPSRTPDDPRACSLYDFFNCVIPTKWGRTNASFAVNCPEPCESSEYASSRSAAGLSRMSVLSIISAEQEQSLASRVRHAQSLQIRTDTAKFANDIASLLNIVKGYNSLLEFIAAQDDKQATQGNKNRSGSMFRRLHLCLATLVRIARADMQQSLVAWLKAATEPFNNFWEHSRNVSLDYLKQAQSVTRLILNPDRGLQNHLLTSSSLWEAGSHWSHYLQAADDHVSTMLKHVDDVTDYKKQPLLPQVSVYCTKSVHQKLKTSVGELRAALVTLADALSVNNSAEALYEDAVDSISIADESVAEFMPCLEHYHNILHQGAEWAGATEKALLNKHSQLSAFTTSHQMSLELATKDLNYDRAEFKAILAKFLNDELSRVDVAQELSLEQTSMSAEHVSSLVDKVFLQLISAGKADVMELEEEVQLAYYNMFLHLAELAAYFSKKEFLENIQSLVLWQRQTANLNVPDQPGQAATKVHLVDLSSTNESQLKQFLENLVTHYTRPLVQALDDFELELRELMRTLNGELTNAAVHFRSAPEEAQLDETFVKNNFLTVGVYFSQLHRTHTQQQKAYDLAAFFSEVGGFMGLLLGASCMTLVELLDLFVYNSVRKCQQRKRLQKVRQAYG